VFRNAASSARDATEATLATRVKPSSSDFRVIYDEHFNFVWRLLRRFGVRPADMMDVVQRVFLVVHLRLADFEGRSLLRNWIAGICHRVVSDYRRAALVRPEVVTAPPELDSHATPEDGPLTIADSRQRAVQALAILNKLPALQRKVFLLFEVEGMPGTDIAALLDVSVGTVRSRLRLARNTFQREVKRLAAVEAGVVQAGFAPFKPDRQA